MDVRSHTVLSEAGTLRRDRVMYYSDEEAPKDSWEAVEFNTLKSSLTLQNDSMKLRLKGDEEVDDIIVYLPLFRHIRENNIRWLTHSHCADKYWK